MKNTKSLNELISNAADQFAKEAYAELNVIYASEDGFNFFDENRAQIHCKSVSGMKYHTITRTEALKNVIIVDDLDEGQDSLKSKDAEELQELKTQYEELFGKAAHHNVGIDKLKSLIAEKLAESNDQNPEGGENNQQSV